MQAVMETLFDAVYLVSVVVCVDRADWLFCYEKGM